MENPLIDDLWEPMAEFFAKVVEDAPNRDAITVQTFINRFDAHPQTSPYFVVVYEPDKTYSVEISGNIHVRPKLTVDEYNTMALLGWAKPYAGRDEDYGDFPNFVKTFTNGESAREIAETILEVLVLVFTMKPSEMIGVTSYAATEALDRFHILERLENIVNNKNRRLFKMKNMETADEV